jgi:tetratricopeptide (TPR) repeat protein
MFFPFTRTRIETLGAVFLLAFSTATQAQKIVTSGQPSAVTILDSTKEQDGLVGPVRRIRTESAKLALDGDKLVEGQRQLLEVTTYGPRGNRLENVSYPSASSPVGKEEYKYDKGNVVQMTLRDDNGTVLSREAYSYEFDRFGNWTKMVTNLLVYEGGVLKQEPVEVTYRKLTYYFDDEIAKLVEPATEKSREAPASSEVTTSGSAPLAAEPPTVTEKSSIPAASFDHHVEPAAELAKSPEPESASAAPAEQQPVKDTSAATAEPESHGIVPAPEPDHSFKDASTPTADSEASKAASLVKASASLEENNSASGLKTPAKVASDGDANSAATLGATPEKKSPESTSDLRALESFKAGRDRMDAGDLKGAIAAFTESIELHPDSVEARLSLGLAYLKLEKNKDAAKAFKELVRRDPDTAEGQYGLGLANFRIGHHKDAADAFKHATLLRPDMAKAHYGLALAYQELGKSEALLEEFRILQTQDPSLARKLAESFPQANLPCSFKCK